jgi:hypothetical protein
MNAGNVSCTRNELAARTTEKGSDVSTKEIRSHSSLDFQCCWYACSSASGGSLDSMHDLIISCHPSRRVFPCDLEGWVLLTQDRNQGHNTETSCKKKFMYVHLTTCDRIHRSAECSIPKVHCLYARFRHWSLS